MYQLYQPGGPVSGSNDQRMLTGRHWWPKQTSEVLRFQAQIQGTISLRWVIFSTCQIVADVYRSVRDFWLQNYDQTKFAETSACFNVRKHNEHVGFLSNKSFKQTPWCGWNIATPRLRHHRMLTDFTLVNHEPSRLVPSEKYGTQNHYLSSKHHHPEKSFPHMSSYIFHLKHYYWMNPLVNQTHFFWAARPRREVADWEKLQGAWCQWTVWHSRHSKNMQKYDPKINIT